MPAGIRAGLLTACVLAVCSGLMASQAASAESATFSELLARAKAQASAGHRWTPAGDNMTETIMRMMDLIPTATTAQLAELSALLETDKPSTEPAAPPSGPPAAQAPAPNTTASVPSSDQAKPPPATGTPPLASLESHGPVGPRDALPSEVIPLPDSRAAVLFARGLDAENRGDFSGARRYYTSAAQKGSAAAARSLGRLYDPAYLRRTALGGVDPDPALARRWYERAVQLGDTEAGPLLEALSVR